MPVSRECICVEVVVEVTKWTDHEIEILREHYAKGTPIKTIARILNRKNSAVAMKANRLGLIWGSHNQPVGWEPVIREPPKLVPFAKEKPVPIKQSLPVKKSPPIELPPIYDECICLVPVGSGVMNKEGFMFCSRCRLPRKSFNPQSQNPALSAVMQSQP